MTKRKWESTGFGARLKSIREAAGIPQRQLAENVGVDVVTISRLERGEQEPAWPLALAIASALGVTCQAFQQKKDPDDPPPAVEAPAKPRGRPRKPAEPEPSGEKPPRTKKKEDGK